MNIYLVAGINSEAVKQALEKNGINVVKHETSIGDALDYLLKNYLQYDSILLTDQGVINDYHNFSEILEGFKKLSGHSAFRGELKFITKDPKLESVFKKFFGSDERFQVHFTDQVRIPVTALVDFCLSKKERLENNHNVRQEIDETSNLKKPWLLSDRLKSGCEENNMPESSQIVSRKPGLFGFKNPGGQKLSLSSKDCRKVVVVTGHRGSGVTGTVANIAEVASSQGLAVMVVDMDTMYRGINLFFTKFGDEVEVNNELSYSLIRCLMKPESYDINSCMINENLSVITLAYSVSNRDRILEAMDYRRILSLISLLRLKYNLVLIDLPMEVMKRFSDLVTQVDSIGLCVNNNLYSVINTVKTVEEIISKDALLFRTKSRVIVTKYNENNKHNGKKFSPEFTCSILNEISGVLEGEYRSAGIVPYTKEFDLQTSCGQKICNINSTYKNCYFDILKKLL